MDIVEQFRVHGYAVLKGIFDADETAVLAGEFDRILRESEQPNRADDIQWFHGEDPRLGRILRFAQRIGWVDEGTRTWCCSPALLGVVRDLLGTELKVVRNTLFYKPPGAAADHVGFHQDWRFRKPASAFRDLLGSYVQMGVAVDAHGPGNGGMQIYPGSHLLGDLKLYEAGGVSQTRPDEDALRARGLDPARLVRLELERGDAVIWNSFTVHGSEPNRSSEPRRFFVAGYARADCADVGDRIGPELLTSAAS